MYYVMGIHLQLSLTFSVCTANWHHECRLGVTVVMIIITIVCVIEMVTLRTVRDMLAIAQLNVLIDVVDELIDAREVLIATELLDVVVSGAIDVVGRVLVLSGLIKLLCVVEWNNLVASAVYNVDWTLNVWHAVDIRELIDR